METKQEERRRRQIGGVEVSGHAALASASALCIAFSSYD